MLLSFHVKTSSNSYSHIDKMALIKVAWCVFRVKNIHPWSTSHPSWTAPAEVRILDFQKFSMSHPSMYFSGSWVDPRCIFFTLNTHQATFISNILSCDCRKWNNFRTHGRTDGRNHRTGTTDGWTDRRGSRNSYLDSAIPYYLFKWTRKRCPMQVSSCFWMLEFYHK